MNQRIVKNCFSRQLSIDEYLSVLRDTGHAPAGLSIFTDTVMPAPIKMTNAIIMFVLIVITIFL